MKKKPTPQDNILSRLGDLMGSLLSVQTDMTRSSASMQRDLLSTRKEFYAMEQRVDEKLNVIAKAVMPQPTPVHERLCRDCRHAVPENSVEKYRVFLPNKRRLNYDQGKCGHPLVLSRVSGQPVEWCTVERKDYGPSLPTCGSKGTRFERREA